MNNLANKKVSIPLALGIFCIPLIFAWFTLKKGYSTKARVISFGWLAIGFLAFLALPSTPQKQNLAEDKIEAKTVTIEKTADAEAIRLQKQLEDRKAELAEEDKPHVAWPEVDYTVPVAKVDILDDKAIIKAVGKPVIDKESSTDSNGEPMTQYWFSKDISNGLDISLSRENIHVSWQFDSENKEKTIATFNDGQKITRALLGGKEGSDLYEKIAKGLKFDEITLEDGTVVKDARCGQIICRYDVLR